MGVRISNIEIAFRCIHAGELFDGGLKIATPIIRDALPQWILKTLSRNIVITLFEIIASLLIRTQPET